MEKMEKYFIWLQRLVVILAVIILLLVTFIIYNHTKRDLKTVKQELLSTMIEVSVLKAKIEGGAHSIEEEQRFIEAMVEMSSLIAEKYELEGSKDDKLQDMINTTADGIINKSK